MGKSKRSISSAAGSPVSYAGARAGADDPRWLWPECRRIVEQLDPEWCVWENVPGLRTKGLDGVLADIAASGRDAEWFDLRASDVGAPHRRARLFIVAHRDGRRLDRFRVALDRTVADDGASNACEPAACDRGEAVADPNGDGCERLCETRLHDHGARGNESASRGSRLSASFPPLPFDSDGWRAWIAAGLPEPVIRGNVDGVPDRLDRLTALGNAVVGLVTEPIGRAIVESA